MAEDIMTLGFGFTTSDASGEIVKLVEAFTTLEAKSGSAKKAIQQMFGASFAQSVNFARKEIGKLNAGLIQTHTLSLKALSALKPLQTQMAKSTNINVPPVHQTIINSWQQYNTQVSIAQANTQNIAVAVKNIKAAPVQELADANKKAADNAFELSAALKKAFEASTVFAMLKKATQNAVAFGVELAQISSIARNYDMSKIKNGLLELSSSYGGAIQNAEALYYAYSSGVSGSENDLLAFTGEMSKLSVLIRSGVTPTVNAATSAMNAYNISAARAGEITDLFYTIVEKGKASGSELANSFGQVSPTAKTLGLTLNELGAAITSLSKVQPTRVAITGLNNMLSKILKPTKESRLAFQRMGVDVSYSAIQTKGFTGVMNELREALQGNTQEIKNMFPDIRGQRAAMYLLGAGWRDFSDMLLAFEHKSGNANAAMGKLNKNLDYQLSILPNTISKIKIAIGDTVKYILTLGGLLTPVIAAFNNMGRVGQTIVGSIAAIAGVLILLKTVTAAYHGMKLLEIKYNTVLTAQRTTEIAQRTANTGAIAAETSALLANSAARTANAASGAAGTVASMASGGFKAGFDSVFSVSLKSFTRFFAGLMHPIKTLQVLLRAAKIGGKLSKIGALFMKIGVIVGKVAGFFKAAFAVIAGAFSFANVVIAGTVMAIIGIVDILQSLFRTGDWFEGSMILRPIANFLTGYYKEVERAKNLDKNMRAFRNSMKLEKELNMVGENIRKSLIGIFSKNTKDLFAEPSAQSKLMKGFKDVSGSIVSYKGFEDENKEKLEQAKKEAIQAAQAVRIAIETNQSQEKIDKAIKESNEKHENVLKIQDEMNNRQNVIANQYQMLCETVKGQIDAQKSMFKIFDDYRYSIADDAQKKVMQETKYATELNKFQTSLRNQNFSVAEKALKNMMEAHDSLVKMAEADINKYKQLSDTTENDMFNFMLEAYTKASDKINALRSRAGQMYMDSGVSWNGGQVQLPTNANVDLTASYQKVKSAIDLNIRALKLEISEKQKLAQAEMRAVQNTMQLISSMDKFSTTAVDAVNALSTDAVKLQYRSFDRMPTFAPQQQQQQVGLAGLQNELQAAYQKAADVASAFNTEAENRRLAAENEKSQREAEMLAFAQRFEQNTTDLVKQFEPIQDALKKLVSQMHSLNPEAVEKRLETIQNSLKNFGAVTF